MSWNYRVVKYHDPDGNDAYGLHEVFYNDRGEVKMMTARPCGFVGDSVEDLRRGLRLALEGAFSKPVFDEPKEWSIEANEPTRTVGGKDPA